MFTPVVPPAVLQAIVPAGGDQAQGVTATVRALSRRRAVPAALGVSGTGRPGRGVTVYAIDPGTEGSAVVTFGQESISGWIAPNADALPGWAVRRCRRDRL
jgi:hypothetical protein